MCASSSLWKKYVRSGPTVGIFLYVAQAVECVLAVAFGKIYVGLSPTIGTFLYVAQAVERLLAVALGNKLHNITKIRVFHSTCSKNLIERYSTKSVKK